ncbi:MAG: hypothetical protein A2Z16_10770 [Chloroflexi bacterium RBG_16_54_18]|nr:MAG: hypothetical protein A2Z16_10770 [Chloroflexi bacterium RBG_16_54_18]
MNEPDFDTPIERSNTDSYKWRKYGPDVIPMWIADMDFASPEPVISALRTRVEHGIFGYPDGLHNFSEDLPDLRSIIVDRMAERYQWEIQPQDIYLLPGVIPGLNMACLEAGRTADVAQSWHENPQAAGVLVQTPVYPPIFQAADTTARLHQEAALERMCDGSYRVDWTAFETAITEQTRLFILCNPHNPVGKVFQQQELERIAEICLQRDLLICSDEIHCDLIYLGNRHIPIASLDADIAARTITLMAPSKTFNLPGLQCAFAIIPNPELRQRFARVGNGLVSWVGILGLAAAQAAYCCGQEWLDRLIPYLEQNRNNLVECIRQELPGIEVGIPASTYLAWLDCRGAGLDGSTPELNPYFFFLEKAGVALHDGEHFGGEGKGFVRLNFACPRSRLIEAMERMKKAITEHSPNSMLMGR